MKKIFAIGEVLFDCFPGQEVIGGAPFNFLYHVHMLGRVAGLSYEPYMISKVGKDERGEKILAFLKEKGIHTDFIQQSKTLPTGTVSINIDEEGNPSYTIHENVAFDNINPDSNILHRLDSSHDLFYFGTLFQRSEKNRSTLGRYIPDYEFNVENVFVDINLRAPFYSYDVIEESLIKADYLKLNQDELNILREDFYIRQQSFSEDDFIDFLISEYIIQAVIVTKASQGAKIRTHEGEMFLQKAPKLADIIDTVGAGDAFSAMFCIGLSQKWTYERILDSAIRYSAELCRLRGAIPADDAWFDQFGEWLK